jgi:hypothetical protein
MSGKFAEYEFSDVTSEGKQAYSYGSITKSTDQPVRLPPYQVVP